MQLFERPERPTLRPSGKTESTPCASAAVSILVCWAEIDGLEVKPCATTNNGVAADPTYLDGTYLSETERISKKVIKAAVCILI